MVILVFMELENLLIITTCRNKKITNLLRCSTTRFKKLTEIKKNNFYDLKTFK
jgi:hypothetical protein